MKKEDKFALYVHIPFCISRCTYCDFYTLLEKDKFDSYTNAVISEMEKWRNKTKGNISSIYFGGGTPTVLGAKNLAKILLYIKENFSIMEGSEIALEANPNKIKIEDLQILHDVGFNRISFGMQSAVSKELKILARTHRNDDVASAVKMAKEVGFEDISLDLMIGIPYQNEASLMYSLDYILSLNVTHISVYMLQLEEGTPLYNMKDKLPIPDEEKTSEFYLKVVDTLSENGFMQYEISNFAKEGYPSRHNLSYWNGDSFLGIGPSAYSYMDGVRFSYENNLDDFIKNSDFPEIDIVNIEPANKYSDYLMLRLRLAEGIIFSDTEKMFPEFQKDKAHLIENAKFLEKHGLCKLTDDSIYLTKEGFLLSNSVTLKLLDEIF